MNDVAPPVIATEYAAEANAGAAGTAMKMFQMMVKVGDDDNKRQGAGSPPG